MRYFILFFGLFTWATISSVELSAQRVLVIGIDGTRPDCLEAAETPNLDALIANGIFSPDALNGDITMSGPGWSSILCGVQSDQHGVTDNSFSGSNYDLYPSFLKRLETWNSSLHTASICHWGPINDYIVLDGADDIINVSSDEAVRDIAVQLLSSDDPDAIFLHFDDVDITGHGNGYGVNIAPYISAIEGVDALIGDVLSALESRDNYAAENWGIIVTTDHGGIGFGHGGNSIDEQNVFFIASGVNVPTALVLKDTLDILPIPENCLGGTGAELTFAGDGAHVSVPEHTDFAMGAEQDFSVEIRIRTSSTPDVAIIGNKDWGSGTYPGFVFSFEYPSGPAWKVNIGDGSNRADANASVGIDDGQWHTLSCTFDRDGMMRLYTDGEFITEESIADVGSIDVGEGLRFGADINGGYATNGSLAEARFWNGVLSDDAISDWHCAPLDESHPSWNDLTGYWKLDEGEGATEVVDASGNGHDGSINGALWQFPSEMVTWDYSNTPRLVDTAVSAMTHMCLASDPEWDLLGISWLEGCSSTGIDSELPKPSILLYPNPGNDKLYIDSEETVLNVRIYSIIGVLVASSQPTLNPVVIHADELTSGLYAVQIQTSAGWQRRSWIKQ